MIKSFKDRETERLANDERSGAFPLGVQKGARRKLALLDTATGLNDLRSPPGNRLERLTGDRNGQHSIRINDQFRLCFRWVEGDAHDVEITDYHNWSCAAGWNAVCRHVEADMSKKLNPVHPGEILREEFLTPLGLSAYKVAKELNIPANRITGILNEQRAVTADTAVLLGHYFGTSAEMWMNLQARYDLRIAQRAAAAGLRKLPRYITA